MIEIPQAAIDAASTVHGGQITDSAIEKMVRLAVRSMSGLDPDVPADEDHDVIVVAVASTASEEIPAAAVEAIVPLLDRYTPSDAEEIVYDLIKTALPYLVGAQIAEVERLADRWTELRERSEKGRDTTTSMYLAARDDAAECRRLAGKLDGIKTVLSYMDDAERSGR